MVTAVKGGFEIKLGALQGGLDNAKGMVGASQVGELLRSAAGSDATRLAQGKFEFRLLERDGQAFLQLKERNWASKFKERFDGGERNQQRLSAMREISGRFGLNVPGLNAAESTTLADARAFVSERGQKMIDALAARDANGLKLSDDDFSRTEADVRAELKTVAQSAVSEGDAKDGASPLGALFDHKVSTTVARANVKVENDALVIGGTRNGGSAEENYEVVVGFFEQKTGLSRQDPEFKAVLRGVMRNDHFCFAAAADKDFAGRFEGKFGSVAVPRGIQGSNNIRFQDGQFSLSQTARSAYALGAFSFGGQVQDSLSGEQQFERRQSFDLSLDDLKRPDFDVSQHAKNLKFTASLS
jgi:hypothetical protein